MTSQRVLVVGDLHALSHQVYGSPWEDNPQSPGAIGGYLGCVYNLLAKEIPSCVEAHAQGSTDMPDIVFLGDIADEPYRRGKISLDVIHTLREGIAEMLGELTCRAKATKSKAPHVYLIPGNHDRTGLAPADWMNVFHDEERGVHVVSSPAVEGDREVPYIFVPYMSPQQIAAFFSSIQPEIDCSKAVVFGHFAYGSVSLPGGMTYPEADSVPSEYADRFRFSVLGHIHTAQEHARTSYVGLAIPYSFGVPHVSARVHGMTFDAGEEGRQEHRAFEVGNRIGSGVFRGPVSLQEARTKLSTGEWPRERLFLRVELAQGDSLHEAQELASFLPEGSRVFPCFVAPQEIHGEALASSGGGSRLSSAAGLIAGGGDLVAIEATLREYLAHVENKAGALPIVDVSAEELLTAGLALVRGERMADDAAAE